MHASGDSVTAMRRRTGEIMAGPAVVQEWEIALMHRQHSAPTGPAPG